MDALYQQEEWGGEEKSLAPLVPGHLKGAVNQTHLDSREQLWYKEDSADGTE